MILLLAKLSVALLSMTSSAVDNKNKHETKLLSLLKPVFPHVTSVKLIGDPIVQASAVGYRCELRGEDTCSNQVPPRVFVKHVDAAKYAATKKDWHDLRRALVYVRTEVRFYNSVKLDCIPNVEYARYDLEGLINENEHVTNAGERTTMPSVEECEGKGGLLVLDLIPEEDYHQASPLTIEQCKQCLSAIAALHKAAWQDEELLTIASKDLSIPTFSLALRNPKELAGIEVAWEKFRVAFQDDLEGAGLWNRTETLAIRLKENAEWIAEQLSPSPTDPYATLVHGDYKAMNAFLPRKSGDSGKLVDFASAGIGNPMMDVAMHISHACLPQDLAAIQSSGLSGEEELFEHYINALDIGEYRREVAWHHYKLAFCDYLRFFVGRMWASATPETMKSKLNNPNINNINRYPEAAMAFIDRGERYLTEIEAMRRET